MLIIWAYMYVFVATFFSVMVLVGAGYLVSFVVRRARSRELVPESAIRRAYTADALKAA